MTSIGFPDLMIVVFVLVDDWYQRQIAPLEMAHPGARPQLSDSEMLTLGLLMDYLPFPGETQFLGFIQANYASWFPHLLGQSQFNRRLRRLDGMLEQLRRSWVVELGATAETHLLIDTKPLPVLGLKRDKTRSDFSGNAAPGYCAARQMYYFGYKLTLLSTWDGIPIAYDLVPANTDERVAVESLFDTIRGCTLYGDKGFIDSDWQHQLYQRTGNQVWTLQRKNQKQQHPAGLNRFISRVRQRIEGVFHEIQNTGRNPERLVNKTVEGFCVHIAAKLASHTLRLLLKRRFAIDVLTFRQATACSS